jgi:hypothetical protein
MSVRTLSTLLVLVALVATPTFVSAALDDVAAPVVVGTAGNEPLIKVASDGTIYISALQHLYRSTNGGASWVQISPSPYASSLNFNSDSSLAFGLDGKTLYMSFDWPYAGLTAVCVTSDRGATWLCDPGAVPTPSDRMWVHTLPSGNSVLVTGIALVATTTFVSVVPGVPAYVPSPIQPLTSIGQLGDFAAGYGAADSDGVLVAPTSGSPWGTIRWTSAGSYAGSASTPFHATAIPSLARDGAGKLYGLDDTGGSISLVRNDGTLTSPSWSSFPIVSGGTTRFAAIAAGPAGKVAVVYYRAPAGNNVYYAYKAVSTNANTATPTFTITQLSTGVVHSGDICHSTSCGGTDRYSGDFISATYGPDGVPRFTWMEDYGRPAATVLYGT